MISKTPEAPYYAVIFSSIMADDDGYEVMAKKMLELAHEQNGFLGMESARDVLGISVSYWRDLKAIKQWKAQSEHQVAQKYGKEKWYQSYSVRIAKVEKDYFS